MENKETKTPSWEQIEAEYISTAISQSKLAGKYRIPFRTLADRAALGKWTDKRKAYKREIVQSTVKKLASSASAKDYAKLIRLQAAADRMADAIEDALRDEEQFKRHIVTVGLGMGATRVECNVYDKFDTRAMRDLSATIRETTNAMRNLYQLSTDAEIEAQKIAREKLALEKQKAKRESEADKVSEIQIVFDNEGWAE